MKIPSVTSTDKVEISNRIRSARRSAKLTQTALAKRVGVTPSAAAQWEHPHGTRPSLDKLQKIAGATGVMFEWLAAGSGPRQRKQHLRNDGASALRLEIFAQDSSEEILLMRYRALSPRGREALLMFLEEVRRRHG